MVPSAGSKSAPKTQLASATNENASPVSRWTRKHASASSASKRDRLAQREVGSEAQHQLAHQRLELRLVEVAHLIGDVAERIAEEAREVGEATAAAEHTARGEACTPDAEPCSPHMRPRLRAMLKTSAEAHEQRQERAASIGEEGQWHAHDRKEPCHHADVHEHLPAEEGRHTCAQQSTEAFARIQCGAQPPHDEPPEHEQQHRQPEEAELLGDHGRDEVGVHLGEDLHALRVRVLAPLPGETAGADGPHALLGLGAAVLVDGAGLLVDLLPAVVDQLEDAVLLVLLDEARLPGDRDDDQRAHHDDHRGAALDALDREHREGDEHHHQRRAEVGLQQDERRRQQHRARGVPGGCAGCTCRPAGWTSRRVRAGGGGGGSARAR